MRQCGAYGAPLSSDLKRVTGTLKKQLLQQIAAAMPAIIATNFFYS